MLRSSLTMCLAILGRSRACSAGPGAGEHNDCTRSAGPDAPGARKPSRVRIRALKRCATSTPNAQVRIGTRPLWRIRVAREWPRYLLSALAVAGLAASARFAIDPPRPAMPRVTASGPAPPDLAAEGFAAQFARSYLTWNAAEPQAHEAALAAFVGPGIDPDAGLQPPSSGEQRVEWAEVVQERELELVPARPEHVYTVAAQTDDAGLQYLTVSVVRTAGGSLALGGYPAFVGAPASGPAQTQAQSHRAKSANRRSRRSWRAPCATTSPPPARSSPRI